MKNVQREDIHIISRHSNLQEQSVDKALKENVYNNKTAWQQFFRLLFLSLGVGFTVAGIVFFFAYNWADLHKFAKIGLTEGLLIAATALVFLPRISDTTRNIILTGASVLTGVLFAVYGQIYQTGANAYDFFLAWTIFVTLWTWVSKFPPLWLLYLVLVNTTFILYYQQVANHWSPAFMYALLFIMNTGVLIGTMIFARRKTPDWFLHTVALAATTYATIGVVSGIFGKSQIAFPFLILATVVLFALGIWHGRKTRNGFYLSVIPFSIVIMLSALLIKISDGEMMLLLVSGFIITSVTLIIKNLIHLQRKRIHENERTGN